VSSGHEEQVMDTEQPARAERVVGGRAV